MQPLEQIYHYEQLTDQIGCSGQPAREWLSVWYWKVRWFMPLR